MNSLIFGQLNALLNGIAMIIMMFFSVLIFTELKIQKKLKTNFYIVLFVMIFASFFRAKIEFLSLFNPKEVDYKVIFPLLRNFAIDYFLYVYLINLKKQ